MSEGIRVSVVEFGDRRHYQLQWIDPATGRKRTQSSKIERTGRKREVDAATRKARDLESELNQGADVDASKTTWEAFKERYTLEVADHLANATAAKVATVFSLVDRLMQPPPKRLADVTAGRISELVTRMLEEKDAEGKPIRTVSTVASHCRHLSAALRWGKSVGLLRSAPTIRPPKVPKGEKVMKGRPITAEEYERMLTAVSAALTPDQAKPTKRRPDPSAPTPPAAAVVVQWQRFLTGLWWSGLRLGEALTLSWDASAAVSVMVQPGYHPVFRFRPEGQKAKRAELCPMAPEFAEFLEAIPEVDRVGLVLPLPLRTKENVSAVISAIGSKAGVVVDHASGKTASAHDFRRAFGTRWARRIMPAQLQKLMRHESITTTLKYYVSQEVNDIGNDLWDAYRRESNSCGNSRPKTARRAARILDATHCGGTDLAKLPRLDSNQE